MLYQIQLLVSAYWPVFQTAVKTKTVFEVKEYGNDYLYTLS